ncbi:transposase [Klebsiella pneumoniae subsp. pneumoniae]|nr:transposase [Klebsiella pneumoniae]WJT19272.1 transposase [Klebsiella pneumoniae subsp. pneumoniae]
MKKTRYTEEQIAFALKQAETGTRVEEVCRKMGISEATFYNWKKKFGGMSVTKLRRLRQLEEENQRLKRLVADLSLDKVMLRKLSKKVLRPAQKRQAVHFLREAYRISVRRGCGLLMQSRTVYHWQSRRDDRAITLRIREIAETRIRYGCPRIHIQLRREGWPVNHKKTHRIYCLEGLNLRKKRPRRHVSAAHRQQRPVLISVIDRWLNERIKDKVMLLIVGLQIDPVVTNNTAEAAVALLLGNRLTQEALDPLALLHRPDAAPSGELSEGMRMAAWNVPLKESMVKNLWLAGMTGEQRAEAIGCQNAHPAQCVKDEAVISLDISMGNAGAAAPWLAIAAATEIARQTQSPQMIICGDTTQKVLWSTLITPIASRQEMDL